MDSKVPQIFICSKGRAGKTTTDKILERIPVEYAFVVEPQEAADYTAALRPNGRVIVLPEGGRGLPYSRERTKEIAQAAHEYYIVLDDDIENFSEVKNGRARVTHPDALLKGLEYFKESGLALMSFEYRQYAWAARQELCVGKACDCCVFFNAKKTENVHFDEAFRLKGDRDFCVQLALLGERFGRLNRYAIQVPNLGSNGGGLQDLYKQREDEKYAQALFLKYGPKICKLFRKKDGRLDVRIDFNKLY